MPVKKIKDMSLSSSDYHLSIWNYHRFNTNYRDIEGILKYRGMLVSYKIVRACSINILLM